MRSRNIQFKRMTEAYLAMHRVLGKCTPEQRRKLVRTAKTKTTTNCGWHEYRVAQHILEHRRL